GSAPFEQDTLVSAEEVALGIDIGDLLFKSRVNIDQLFVSNENIHVQVNKEGQANYNIYASAEKASPSADTSETAVTLEKIVFEDVHFLYNDASVGFLLDAKGFNYTGKGDLSQSLFDLYSRASIDSLDLYLDHEPYLVNKKLDARLVTKVNTLS